MARLKVTRADGNENVYQVTPILEYAFEQYSKKGFQEAFTNPKQSDLYWLCWEAIRRSGETVKPFGEAFLETLTRVEVLEDDFLE